MRWDFYEKTLNPLFLGLCKNTQIRSPKPKKQTAIATVLSDMDAKIAALEQRRNKTKAIKQAMMPKQKVELKTTDK